MNNCVLLQQAHGEHEPLLALSYPHHKAYCAKHSIDYCAIFGKYPLSENLHSQWFKVDLILAALIAGYQCVVWLDVDTLIVADEDIRNGVPKSAIGACWHTNETWSRLNEYDHFNVGALYVSNSQYVQQFLATWKYQSDEGHQWFEQHSFNKAASELMGVVKPISHRWNSVPNVYEDGEPAVKAWHGCFDVDYRLEQMRLELSKKDDVVTGIS